MKLKEIDRTVHVAWTPATHDGSKSTSNYLVAGTAAQQLDASFSTNSQLELFQVDLGDRSMALIPISSIKTDYRFNKLIWPSSKLLIGATEKGRIYLVDPFAKSVIQELDKHTGSVHSIDMNTLQTNLFASGGSNSELMIWDLNDLKQPMTPGGSSSGSHQHDEEVQCVAWNRQKSHILGSTLGGKTLIWDLKSSNEPIFKISDSTYRMRANRLIWHPEITSQLCLASEEDQSAAIQLWDLRYGASPMKLLTGHTRGILDLQWSPNDANLIMSSGKDNKIICWNPNDLSVAAETVYEIPCNHWCFDVKWCLVDPNLISASSFDGTLSVYTLMGGSCQISRPVNNQLFTQAFGDFGNSAGDSLPATTTHDVAPIKYAPKWMRRQSRVSFAFGGKLVIVQPPSSTVATESGPPSPNINVQRRPPVIIQQVVVDQSFVQAVQTFDNVLQTGNVLEYCDHQINSANNSQDEQILWRFLRGSFDSDPKQHYVELLGFRRDDILRRAQTLSHDDKTQDTIEALNGLQLGDQQKKRTHNYEADTILNRCLMLGQFQAAVDICLNEERYAEALLLAHIGGQELLVNTQKRYLEKVQSSSTKLMNCILNQDWKRLIETSSITNWRDVLVTLLTYTHGSTFTNLCNELGERLLQQNTISNDSLRTYASICFICAGNLEQFDVAWSSKYHQQDMSPIQLEHLIEKLFILKRSLEYSNFQNQQQKKVASAPVSMDGPSISRHLAMFGQLLANEGCSRAALLYLGNQQTPELILLRDRLYNGLPANQTTGIPKPPGPFRRVDIAAPQKQQPQQPQSQFQPQTRKPSGSAPQHFRPQNTVEQTFVQPAPATWQPSVPTIPHDINPRIPTSMPTNRYSMPPNVVPTPTPNIPTYQPTHFNPVTNNNASQMYNPASHTMPPNMMQPTEMSAPPMGTSSAPSPLVPSYQDTKPANAWNDPPAVLMKTNKSNVVKSSIPSTDASISGNNLFTPGNPNESVPSSMHYNPTLHSQTTPNMFNPSLTSDFVHHPQIPSMTSESNSRTAPTPPPPPAPVVKGPIPSEHQIIQDTFDLLVNRCQQATQQLPLKRKLDEVKKKLDVLYDKLRDNKVPPSVLQGIHQMIGYIRQYDYQTSLTIYNQMVATENIAETSQYMPSVKILLQCCIQLNVFCQ